MLKIFSDKYIHEDKIDFTKWETANGDFVNIKDVGDAYLERNLGTLDMYLEKYPDHVNQHVWQRYVEELENVMFHREDTPKIQLDSDKATQFIG